MTQEERVRYFKFYRGEEFCPDEWCGEPQGVIWGAERNMEYHWESISSGDWDRMLGYNPPRPLEESMTDFVVSTAQRFCPFDWWEVERFYRKIREKAE